MMLLERESQLAALRDYAREARGGDGRLVLVGGEAGIGKSALVERLAEDLPDARWSWGACDPLFTPRPLGPLFELAGQLGGELAELCRVRSPREELFGALLRQVGDPGALDVLVVEDVHWADEATVDLLRFLSRRVRATAVLLIVTYRDDTLTAADPLRLALGEIATQRSTRRISLAPLSALAVELMTAGSTIDPAELLRLTGGNPFYVGAVIQAGLAAVPQSAGDAVLARTARLSAGAREALDAAALTGSRVEVPLLAAVTACRPAHLDELTASGLLSGDGGWLKFRHEIARLAVEQAIAGHRAAAIHAQILAALADLGPAEEARLAFHAEAAGDAAAVLRFAPLAARRAAEVASHREAAAQFERALRFAASADRDVVADLYDGIAREFSLLDRWQDAAEAGERALILWRAAGDRLREGDTLLRLSRTMWRLCRGKESAQAAEAALEVLMPLGPSVALARAYANLAVQRMTEGADDAAIDLAGRAVALAESLGVTEVLSDALNTRACALEHAGRDASGLLRRALDIALAGRLDEQAGRAYANLHALDCSRRQFAAAERLYLEGIAFCDDHDIGTYATCLRGERTGYLEKTGRWDEGALLAADLLARAGASPVNRLNPLISLGKIRARRAEPGAWECLDEAALAADASAEPSQIVAARLARAEAHWLRGEPAAARGQAELAADAAAWCDSWERGAIAAWLRRTGSDRSLDGEFPPPFAAELAGDWAAAARGWHELGCPYDGAMALLDGPDDGALREALRIFDALGAAAAARMTRQKMRRLGLRSIPAGPQTATRAHPRGLTRREREVLDLICAGQTNAQIAERLFISVKTVHHHVSAVLAKLKVPSRDAAATQAAQLGLAGAAGSR